MLFIDCLKVHNSLINSNTLFTIFFIWTSLQSILYCSLKEVSVRLTLVLQAIKTHVKSTVSKFLKTLGLNYSCLSIILFEVINAIESKRYTVSEKQYLIIRFVNAIYLFATLFSEQWVYRACRKDFCQRKKRRYCS